MKRYDIFISYRRDGAEDFARAVYQDLRHNGFNVFLDRQDLSFGDYENQVLNVIEGCRDVIIILPPHALDRCNSEDDLFRKEISCAMRCNKNIISIAREGFRFPAEDELPEDIRKFPKIEAIIETPNSYDGVMNRLTQMLRDSQKKHKQAVMRKFRLPIIISSSVLAAVIIGVLCLFLIPGGNEINSYSYPREINAHSMQLIKDNGNLQNVYLGLSKDKLFKNLGLEYNEYSTGKGTEVCRYMIRDDIISFPFDGETCQLGEQDEFGKYDAAASFYFHDNECEFYSFAIATDDKRAATKAINDLYRRYNNGTGEKGKNARLIHNVKELGGSLYMGYLKNKEGQNILLFKVYNPIENIEEEALPTVDVTVSDYKDKVFSHYDRSGNVTEESTITEVNTEVSGGYIKVDIVGKKTLDCKSEEHLSKIYYDIRLIGDDGTVINTTTISTPDIRTGETFKAKTTISFTETGADQRLTIEITGRKYE